MHAIILAGGYGTRLRPLTCTVPKLLLPVINVPFINYQLDLLEKHGIKKAVLSLGRFNARLFKKRLNELNRRKLKITIAVEDKPLGTGGAIRFAWPEGAETVVVFNGDILMEADITKMLAFHRKTGAAATIGLIPVPNPSRYGLVVTDVSGRVLRFLEKPCSEDLPPNVNTINAGIYVLSRSVLDSIQGGREVSIEREVFPGFLTKRLPVYGFEITGYWLDMGTVDSYKQVHADILSGKAGAATLKNNRLRRHIRKTGASNAKLILEPETKIGRNVICDGYVFVGAKSVIGDKTALKGVVSIGRNNRIGAEVTATDVIMLDNVKVGDKVCLEGCVIGNNCVIESNASLGRGTVLGDGSLVKAYSRC